MAIAKFVGGPLDGMVYPPSTDPSASLPTTIVATAAGAFMQLRMPPGPGKVGQADQLYVLAPSNVTITGTTYTLTSGNYV